MLNYTLFCKLMRYFINANIVKHFTHALFKNGIYLIHLWLQLQVYISSLNSHYYYVQNLYIQLIRIILTTH